MESSQLEPRLRIQTRGQSLRLTPQLKGNTLLAASSSPTSISPSTIFSVSSFLALFLALSTLVLGSSHAFSDNPASDPPSLKPSFQTPSYIPTAFYFTPEAAQAFHEAAQGVHPLSSVAEAAQAAADAATSELQKSGFFIRVASVQILDSEWNAHQRLLSTGQADELLHLFRKSFAPINTPHVLSVLVTASERQGVAGLSWRGSSCIARHASVILTDLKSKTPSGVFLWTRTFIHELLHFLGAKDIYDIARVNSTMYFNSWSLTPHPLEDDTLSEIKAHSGPGMKGRSCFVDLSDDIGTPSIIAPGSPSSPATTLEVSLPHVLRVKKRSNRNSLPLRKISLTGTLSSGGTPAMPLFTASNLPPDVTLDSSTGTLRVLSTARKGVYPINITLRDVLTPELNPVKKQVILSVEDPGLSFSTPRKVQLKSIGRKGYRRVAPIAARKGGKLLSVQLCKGLLTPASTLSAKILPSSKELLLSSTEPMNSPSSVCLTTKSGGARIITVFAN